MRPVMEPLSREFIDSCRREEGRIIRGDNMTRIETFVDAAFAFAFTMLVISIDEIPKSPPELFDHCVSESRAGESDVGVCLADQADDAGV